MSDDQPYGGPVARPADEFETDVMDDLARAARRGILEVWNRPDLAEFRATHSISSAMLSVLAALLGELLAILWQSYDGDPGQAPRARKQLLLRVYKCVREATHGCYNHRQREAFEAGLAQTPPGPAPLPVPQPKQVM